MARTGKYTKSPEMWKHLRPFLKRKFHKAERVAIKKDLDISDEELYDLEKLGLRKDFATMIKLRKEKGEILGREVNFFDDDPTLDNATEQNG